MDSKPDTVRGDTAAAAAGANPPVVRWPEPSPLADWWDEVMYWGLRTRTSPH